jgi:predicted flap endonuclease-1-like 5' DNA nuclease
MPYTLMKGLGWVLGALLLGIVIGWLLRSVAAKRQVSRARAHHVETAELERLRGRVANLEPVVVDRDRLKAELEAVRASARPDRSVVERSVEPVTHDVPGTDPVSNPEPPAAPSPPAIPDLLVGSAVLGKKIRLDDLKVIEGVGPKIETLCHGIGIRTWFDLSTTEVSLLRTMLADAGSQFRTHNPQTWPQQAALLAAGEWEAFKALTDELDSGVPSES